MTRPDVVSPGLAAHLRGIPIFTVQPPIPSCKTGAACRILFQKEDKPGYIMSSSLEPISPFADIIQHFASFAYHGGYNSSSIIEYFPKPTSGELWEVKHWRDDLVNFTTRGNVSLLPHGVCAHNSTKSGYVPDSYEDRLWLMTQVLSRTGPVAYTTKEWPIFKELVRGEPFAVRTVTRNYDLKRKPDRQSFQQIYVTLDGKAYEIANFTTVPYETAAEYRKYREVKKSVDCLRTTEDWNRFFDKVTLKGSGLKVRDLDWAILNSCIMGHRAKLWNIPKLNVLTGVPGVLSHSFEGMGGKICGSNFRRIRAKEKAGTMSRFSLSRKPVYAYR